MTISKGRLYAIDVYSFENYLCMPINLFYMMNTCFEGNNNIFAEYAKRLENLSPYKHNDDLQKLLQEISQVVINELKKRLNNTVNTLKVTPFKKALNKIKLSSDDLRLLLKGLDDFQTLLEDTGQKGAINKLKKLLANALKRVDKAKAEAEKSIFSSQELQLLLVGIEGDPQKILSQDTNRGAIDKLKRLLANTIKRVNKADKIDIQFSSDDLGLLLTVLDSFQTPLEDTEQKSAIIDKLKNHLNTINTVEGNAVFSKFLEGNTKKIEVPSADLKFLSVALDEAQRNLTLVNGTCISCPDVLFEGIGTQNEGQRGHKLHDAIGFLMYSNNQSTGKDKMKSDAFRALRDIPAALLPKTLKTVLEDLMQNKVYTEQENAASKIQAFCRGYMVRNCYAEKLLQKQQTYGAVVTNI